MTIRIAKPNATFIHIPKNAGTSISRWLITFNKGKWSYQNHHGGKHFTLDQIRRVDKKDLGYIFACIRNPWDRIVSGYFYYRKRKKLQDITFEQWIHGGDWGQLNKAQAQYFQDDEIDHIIRFENIQEDFKIIQQVFQCSNPVTQENKSKHRSYRDYYTPELVDIVAQRHGADIKRFGYEFE